MNHEWLCERGILASKNEKANQINPTTSNEYIELTSRINN